MELPSMWCPSCHKDHPTPLSGSTYVVVWYVCRVCGHFWSARLRNGQPVDERELELAARS